MMKAEQQKISVARQRTVCVITDWATTFVAFLCFDIFRFYYMGLEDVFEDLGSYLFSGKLILEQLLVPVCLLFIYWLTGYYNKPFERSRLNEFLLTFYSQLFNAIVIYLIALTNDKIFLRSENWILLLILFLFLFLFTYIGRLIVTENMIKTLTRLDIRPKTVIIGLSEASRELEKKLKDPSSKIKANLIGKMPFGNEKVTDEAAQNSSVPLINSIEELQKLCKEKKVEQVIIVPAPGKNSSKKTLFFLYNLYPYDVSIKINPDVFSIITPTIRLQDIMGEPLIDLSTPQVTEFSKNIKRTLDVIVASVGLTVLSPFLACVALAVKLSGPGKIFYSQERMGMHRKPFKIYKFRSMIPEAEKDGIPLLSEDNDVRITKIGKWLRKYRIDEFPQLWNVIRGDMSLVGPRPERAFFIEQIIRKAPWYTLVLQLRPGITSWGMVKYGYATTVEQMIERNRFDLIYLANMSLPVDIKIMLHTIKTVTSGLGK